MSWVDSVINAVTRSRNVIVAPYVYQDEKRSDKATLTETFWTSPLYGAPRDIDYTDLEQYESDLSVAAAVNFIIDSVATCEWHVIGDEEIEGSDEVNTDVATEFFKAQDWEDSFENVLRAAIADILHYDAGTLVLKYPEFCYDEDKTLIKTDVAPLSIRARDGRAFLAQVNRFGDILKWWQYSFLQTSTPIEFVTDEIIYIKEHPTGRSPYGRSKLKLVSNVADLMMAVQLGHRSEQEQQIAIGGIIRQENVNDAEMLKRLSMMYNSMKGEGNRGKWLVVGSDTSVEPLAMPNIDDSWVLGAEWYQMQILSIFKVPKTILGFVSSDTNRATSISQATSFKRNGSATMMTLLENIFTREIVKKFFDDKLVFRFVREQDMSDEAIRADIDAKNVATGIVTANEIREDRGLEPLEEPVEPEPEGTWDWGNEEGETVDERVEDKTKSVNVDKLESDAVKELEDWGDDKEKVVLKELESLYNE